MRTKVQGRSVHDTQKLQQGGWYGKARKRIRIVGDGSQGGNKVPHDTDLVSMVMKDFSSYSD